MNLSRREEGTFESKIHFLSVFAHFLEARQNLSLQNVLQTALFHHHYSETSLFHVTAMGRV